jgi:hypothetical protein
VNHWELGVAIDEALVVHAMNVREGETTAVGTLPREVSLERIMDSQPITALCAPGGIRILGRGSKRRAM